MTHTHVVRTSEIPALTGLRVIPSDELLNGEVYVTSDTVLIGCRPHTTRERARYDARAIVQNGLADVLAWLGEKPIPRTPLAGRQLMDQLIRSAELVGGPKDGSVIRLPFSSEQLRGELITPVVRPISLWDLTHDHPIGPLFDKAHYRQLWERRWGVLMPVVNPESHYVFKYAGGA